VRFFDSCSPHVRFSTEGGVGAVTAAVTVLSGCKGNIGIENLSDGFFEVLDETVSVDGDVFHGFTANDERGVVALGPRTLDEEQSRAYWEVRGQG